VQQLYQSGAEAKKQLCPCKGVILLMQAAGIAVTLLWPFLHFSYSACVTFD
jgi:hypothetical protein